MAYFCVLLRKVLQVSPPGAAQPLSPTYVKWLPCTVPENIYPNSAIDTFFSHNKIYIISTRVVK